MTDTKNQLQKFAMYFGTYMGVFWIIKFIAFPLSFSIPFLSLLFLTLTIAVPFLGYYYTKSYRNKICGGYITFAQAAFFTLLMYLYASLLAAAAHFIYFQFIDHGYVAEQYIHTLQKLAETPGVAVDQTMLETLIATLNSLTPTDITMQFLSWDMFFGALLSVPTGLLAMRYSKQP